MVRVLVYLIVIAALAAGAVWLADRPGEVSILWQGYRIETSVAIARIGMTVMMPRRWSAAITLPPSGPVSWIAGWR